MEPLAIAPPATTPVGVAPPLTPEQQWAAYQQQWGAYNYAQQPQVWHAIPHSTMMHTTIVCCYYIMDSDILYNGDLITCTLNFTAVPESMSQLPDTHSLPSSHTPLSFPHS
jgi:hypothetical protein